MFKSGGETLSQYWSWTKEFYEQPSEDVDFITCTPGGNILSDVTTSRWGKIRTQLG